MNEVLPSPHTRTSAPMRPRHQPSRRPIHANSSQAPKNVTHIPATRNHSCASSRTCGISSSTSAGSAMLSTHQFSPCTMPAGGCAKRRTSAPSTRQTNSSSNALIADISQGTSAALDAIRPAVGSRRRRHARMAKTPNRASTMSSKPYDFRQFQAELAALDQGSPEPKPEPKPAPKSKPLGKKAAEAERLARVRAEFLALRDRHNLSVADVVAFFPEEEGIAYLQQLLATAEQKPRRRKKPPST